MWCVADQHESPRPNLPEKPRTAEVVDAEVVDSEVVEADAPARPQQPADDAEFRQYQQFLEFQKFREWQRSQDGEVAVPPPAAPPAATPTTPKKAWWKRALGLLRYKLVRRLIYLLLALLLLNYLYNSVMTSWFGSTGSDNGSTNTGAPPDSAPMKARTPAEAVLDVYNLLRGDDPTVACAYFEASAKSGFAAAHQAPDCATAARRLHDQITIPGTYANPSFGENAVNIAGPDAQVLGCRMQVTGGPRLGSFKLTQQPDGGWAISAYALQTPSCGD
ncbi:hypothetical protein ACWEV3_25390 [Saccharopolyspora sp. NPDC003752]